MYESKKMAPHCLILCSVVRRLWKSSPWWKWLKDCSHMSMRDIFFKVADVVDDSELDLFCVCLWRLGVCVMRRTAAFPGKEIVAGFRLSGPTCVLMWMWRGKKGAV
ncbi:uncharacterized protein LOC130992690 [Salvia miltiorrhiza]|uniref:uncharacterized protein LOC130992689 n=1 Tax=Salvia miltiorrhiza TaxID=226208 RepID=UPI0025AC3FAB|nr:uncharacterized protein LOC130992689 [Salvia miltiorrhiza]XP_057773424.1 uncharacterized protein LOC130992690 [Salvia miltiorrhiza]